MDQSGGSSATTSMFRVYTPKKNERVPGHLQHTNNMFMLLELELEEEKNILTCPATKHKEKDTRGVYKIIFIFSDLTRNDSDIFGNYKMKLKSFAHTPPMPTSSLNAVQLWRPLVLEAIIEKADHQWTINHSNRCPHQQSQLIASPKKNTGKVY